MPKKDNKTVASEFLTEVLEKSGLAGHDKGKQLAALLADTDLAPVLDLFGQGTKRQSEFSQEMDRLTKWKENLEGWFKTNQTKLQQFDTMAEELAALKEGRGAGGDEDDPTKKRPPVAPTLDPAKFMTVEAHTKAMREAEESVVPFVAIMNRLGFQHFREFNEVLDTEALFKVANDRGLRLDVAYEALVADARAAKAKTANEEALKRAREEGAAEERKKLSGRLPFPTQDRQPSTLDGLEKSQDSTVDAAVAAYHEIQAHKAQAAAGAQP